MKKIVLIVLMTILVLAGVVLVLKYYPTQKKPPPQNQTTPQPTPQPQYFYPISRYEERLTVRKFGQLVSSTDNKKLACGAPFSGYHTGDDLEAFPEELNQDVPIYSIASGTVRQVSSVSGYGGLIVIEYNLDNQIMTAYFGHINLNSTNLKSGDTVTPNQFLANLGQACSIQTGSERKHLHFALHKGTAVDVRGYVQNQGELENWLNPADELKSLNELNPK